MLPGGLTEGEEPDLLVFCNRDSLFYLNPDGLSEGASGLTVTSALWGSRRKQSRDQLSATTKQTLKSLDEWRVFCSTERTEVRLYSSMLANVSLRGYNV